MTPHVWAAFWGSLILTAAVLIIAACIVAVRREWARQIAAEDAALNALRQPGEGELDPHDPIWADTLAAARAKANPYDALGSDQ